MINEKNNLTNIDVEKILLVGKMISNEEVMKEITQVPWSEDVLNGNYIGKIIVRENNNITNSSIEEKAPQKIYKR